MSYMYVCVRGRYTSTRDMAGRDRLLTMTRAQFTRFLVDQEVETDLHEAFWCGFLQKADAGTDESTSVSTIGSGAHPHSVQGKVPSVVPSIEHVITLQHFLYGRAILEFEPVHIAQDSVPEWRGDQENRRFLDARDAQKPDMGSLPEQQTPHLRKNSLSLHYERETGALRGAVWRLRRASGIAAIV